MPSAPWCFLRLALACGLPAASAGSALPIFTGSFASGGATYRYTVVGGPPQAGGTTTIPAVIIPVSFVFDEYPDSKGAKLVLDASRVVPKVVRSPIFRNYPFSTGNTQYGDAIQRAQFWNGMGKNWHTVLGQPTVLPAVPVEIERGHAYVMRSQTTGERFAVIDIVAAHDALMRNLDTLEATTVKPGQLVIYLFHNASFYGTTLAEYALWASDPTVCCSFGWHGAVKQGASNGLQTYILASYVDPGLLPFGTPGMTAQSSGPLPVVSDVQALSEQIVEWMNDPFHGNSAQNKFPAWLAPHGVFGTCGGPGLGDVIFSAEPARFLLPAAASTEVSANGFTYHLQNAALLPWYEQAALSSAFNGAYSFPDTKALTGPAQSCNVPIPAPAARPLSEIGSNGHALIGYWESYLGPEAFAPLRDVSPQFDVVIVSFATPAKGSKSLLQFGPPSGQTDAQFKSDVKYLQSRGKKVLISVGGGGTVVTLSTAADVKNFVESLSRIVREYGFDGIDLDIENPSLVLNPGDNDFRHPTTPSIVNLIAACRQLRSQLGPSFMLAIVPEVAQAQAGFASYTGMSGSFLPVIHALRDILSFVDAQDYNTPPLPALDGNFYVPGTVDYHVAMTEMLLAGFPVGHDPNHFFPPLAPEKVAIGVPAGAQVRNFVSIDGLSDALNYLMKGASFDRRTGGGQYKLRKPAGYPNLLGMMTWAVSLDRWNNYQFSNTIGPLLHGMPQKVPVAARSH